ncbi:MAG: hypothetical protein KA275_00055 [Chitinophagaceae bacterium]|nr:hypothetical protein [Chitinophagaceae bacterium]
MKYIFLFIYLFSIVEISFAQNTSYSKPTVILFKLRTSTRKIEYLKKYGSADQVKEVQEDDRAYNKEIVRDFKENFTYCPVYFFYDSDYDLAQKNQWEKMTFYDAESFEKEKKIEAIGINNFYFADIGFYPADTNLQAKEFWDARAQQYVYSSEVTSTNNYGIILYNEKFEALHGKMRFTDVIVSKKGNFMKKNAMRHYFEGAARLQKKALKFFEN